MLEIFTLGGLSIRCGGQPLGGFASRKVEALLVYLACVGRPKAREVLAELLWEERSPSQSLSNLRVALSSLRKQVAPYLTISRDAVGLNPDAGVWLDAAQLGQQLAAVRDQGGSVAPQMVAAAKRAVALYHGDFLEGFYLRDSTSFENWALLERERIRAVHEQLAQWLLDALLASECWHDVVEWGEHWIALGESPEPAYRAVMQAYGGLGDLGAVRAVYRRCAEALDEDLGVEPSGQTRTTYQDLLNGRWQPRSTVVPPAPVADSAARALLRRWQDRDREVLDLPSLAVVYASRADLVIGPEESGLLIRSALHHGVDVEPWLRRAGSPQAAVAALAEAWERYPKPRVRMQIVSALAGLSGQEAAEALVRIVRSDDAPEIRTESALAAAAMGQSEPVAAALVTDLGTPREATAWPALVALSDEHGLPEAAGLHLGWPLAFAVARRRLRVQGRQILRQAGRAALGVGLAWALFGLSTPLYTALAEPEEFRTMTEQFLPVPAWMLAAALAALVVGAILGWVLGAATALADVLWRGPVRARRRLLLGTLAGLAYSFYLILFTLIGAYSPSAPPAIYLPVYLLYGLLQGAIATWAIPELDLPELWLRPPRRPLVRTLLAGLAAAAMTVPYVFLVYPADAASALVPRLINAFLFMAGLGLALGRPQAVMPSPAAGTQPLMTGDGIWPVS
jgi:DNA-binding SARP family transcriptional activator